MRIGGVDRPMKMLAEYLENAIKFEKMAAEEQDPKLKDQLEKQASAYRKLAAEIAKQYNLDPSALIGKPTRE
jgi:hypothetical protein